MTARGFAVFCGALYLALGIAGFVPALWERPGSGPALSVRVFHAAVLGVFVVNIISSMVHLVIGLWGVMAANSKYSALVYTRAVTALLFIMGIAGLIPIAIVRTAYGTMPLYGYNVWLHLGTAVIGLYYAIKPGYKLTQIGVQEELNPHITSR